MTWLLVKYLISAAIVVLVSELARRGARVGALVAALPLVTLLALIWMHVDRQPVAVIGNFARYTFWYVLPTLPMFLLFPHLLGRFGFWPALALAALITLGCFIALAFVLKPLGIRLL